ncbi:MAG: LbtU family siderophore porin [Desulfobacterales bacterium]
MKKQMRYDTAVYFDNEQEAHKEMLVIGFEKAETKQRKAVNGPVRNAATSLLYGDRMKENETMKKHGFVLFAAVIFVGTALVTASGSPEEFPSEEPPGGVKSLEDRIEQLEKAIERQTEGKKWYDRIRISGLIEIEAGYEETDFSDPAVDDEKTGDIDLATIELVMDVAIADFMDGHVMIKYEDDDLFVDEGFITLFGTEAFPAFLIAGRQYLPFGYFESHFITDSVTLVLGETNDEAIVAGYSLLGEKVNLAIGAFNADAKEAGDDDVIDGFVASANVYALNGLTLGASYTSNLAGSGAFEDAAIDPDNLESLVGGLSAYAVFDFLDRFRFIGEIVTALDHFKAGEIYDVTDIENRQPMAWNAEFGFLVADAVGIAARYAGSDDGGDLLPETEYGAVLNWRFYADTNLAVEYLHNDFEGDAQDTDRILVQLAVLF